MNTTNTHVYAVPGKNSIIDEIDSRTGLTRVYGHTEAEVLRDEPRAVRMTWDEWQSAAIERQRAEPLEWVAVTRERYHEMLNILPPLDWDGPSFLVSEPTDHDFETGRPRFTGYIKRGTDWFSAYYRTSRPVTRQEFRAFKYSSKGAA